MSSKRCIHEYLPDEDGTVYTCGSDYDVVLTDLGWLCEDHRGDAKEVVCHCGEDGYYHCSELREKVETLQKKIESLQLALRNVHMYAHKSRQLALHEFGEILRFCEDVGIKSEITRHDWDVNTALNHHAACTIYDGPLCSCGKSKLRM